jgi:Fic family protein
MAGMLRGPDDNVHVFDGVTEEILHTPPQACDLESRLSILCEFANSEQDSVSFIHPVLKAIIIHFMIGYDHPFIDGNGRTARALFYWFMLRSGYWMAEYVSISSVIKDSPIQYGRAYLETETDEADLTYFIVNQCRVISEAEKRLSAYIERKRSEVGSLAAIIEKGKRDGGFNHRQTSLLNDLIRRRMMSINIVNYQRMHVVSYHTARNDLEQLTGRGLLLKRRLGRDTLYVPSPSLHKKLLGE